MERSCREDIADLSPLDSDEEYVKYRIKIWTVIDRKRI